MIVMKIAKKKNVLKRDIKIVVLGDGGVGKSCVIIRFVNNTFYNNFDPLLDDSYRKLFEIEGEQILTEIAETGIYPDLLDLYLKNGESFIIVYSIVSQSSFENVKNVINNIFRVCDPIKKPILILGNKSDLNQNRVITKEQGQELASNHGCLFMESSALSGENITSSFKLLIENTLNIPKKIPPYQSEIVFQTNEGTMSSDLEKLFNKKNFSDLKIVVRDIEQQEEEKIIYLHQFVIGLRFPAFLEFFGKDNTFLCNDVPYDHVISITHWIYTGILHPKLNLTQLRPSLIILKIYPLLVNVDVTIPTIPPKISFPYLLNEKTLSDVILSVKNHEIFGHRALIGMRSGYFESMFTKGFQESYKEKIVMNVEHQPFFEVLKYIYTGNFIPDGNSILEILDLAHMFGVKGLVNEIGIFLFENSDIENIVDMYNICLRYPEMSPLMEKVKYIVGFYLHKVETTSSFKKLDKGNQDVLRNMLIPGEWAYPDQDKEIKQNCSIQ